MDREEATSHLAQQLLAYRAMPYAQLATLIGTVETAEIRAPSGTLYQLEFQFFWDSEPKGDIRVLGSIDDGGLRAFFPLSQDFIITPDGTFVGE